MKNNAILNLQTAENDTVVDVDADPTPLKRYERVKLQTAVGIGNEIAKVYRLAKAGTLDASIATKLTYILSTLAKVRVEGELEKRIEALERGGNRNA